MVSASMSSRIEAFAQLLTLFIIFILVLAYKICWQLSEEQDVRKQYQHS